MIDLARFATASVPRYTSYPTAPHFSPKVGATQVRRWLRELDEKARISAYFHVPFCQSMCHYCGCHTKVTRQQAPIDEYASYLLAELDLVSKASPAHTISDIHWGGGTPSMLGITHLQHVWQVLNQRFDLSQLSEHAMELDPRLVSAELAACLKQMKVNRVSLGVQDYNADVQKAIGRVQPLEVVQRAIGTLREQGISRINIDLIYGLPLQTQQHISDNVAHTVALAPDRVSVFGYAHVPWMKKHQRLIDEAALPKALERFEQAEQIRRELLAAGYIAIGMDHYARPDDTMAQAAQAQEVHRNFQGYTTDSTDVLIGFGASSISTFPQGYAQNDPSIGNYQRRIAEGELATVRGHQFDAEDKLRGGLIEHLMCNFEVDLDARSFQASERGLDLASTLNQLKALEQDGLVKVQGNHVEMTEAGRPFVRIAAQVFDAYREGGARYSRAI